MPSQLGLQFPTVGGRALAWDLFPVSHKAPVVVCIHGGGWISGDPSMMHDVATCLNSHGFAAACPQYRLAPLGPCPAAIEDVRAFVRYLKANADGLGIDGSAIGALGNSAGGHLAAMLGVSPDPEERANAIVDVCGISDLTDPENQHYSVSHGFLEQFVGEPYYLNPQKWKEASPLHHVDASASPFLLVHGEGDDVVPIAQSEALAGKLFSNGIDVEFHRLPKEGHAFTFEAWGQIEQLFLAFLKRTLRQEANV